MSPAVFENLTSVDATTSVEITQSTPSPSPSGAKCKFVKVMCNIDYENFNRLKFLKWKVFQYLCLSRIVLSLFVFHKITMESALNH